MALVDPGEMTKITMMIHGTIPAMQPNQKGSSPPPGSTYFSCSQPKRIIETLTPKIATMAATSKMPTICAMSTIMMDELSEYSTQRK